LLCRIRKSREKLSPGIAEGETPATWAHVTVGNSSLLCVYRSTGGTRRSDFPFGKLHHIDRRRLLYRLGFVVGRTPVGLEVQQTLGNCEPILFRVFSTFGKQQVAVLGGGAKAG